MLDGQQLRKRPSAEVSDVMMDQPAKIPRGVAQQPEGREGIVATNVAEKQTTSTFGKSSTSVKKTQPSHSAGPVVQLGSFSGTADRGSPDPATLRCQSVLLHGEMSPEGMSLFNRLWPKWRLFMSFAPSMGYSVVEKRQLIILEDVEKIYLPKKPIWEVIADHEAKYRNIRPEYVPPTVFLFEMSDSTRQIIAQLYPDFSGFCFLADYLGYSVIEKRRHILLEDIYLAYKNSLPKETIQESLDIWEEKYNSVRCKFGMPSLPPAVFHSVIPAAPASPQPVCSEFLTSWENAGLDGPPVTHQGPPSVENADHIVPLRIPKQTSGGEVISCPSEVDSNRKRQGKESDDDETGGQLDTEYPRVQVFTRTPCRFPLSTLAGGAWKHCSDKSKQRIVLETSAAAEEFSTTTTPSTTVPSLLSIAAPLGQLGVGSSSVVDGVSEQSSTTVAIPTPSVVSVTECEKITNISSNAVVSYPGRVVDGGCDDGHAIISAPPPTAGDSGVAAPSPIHQEQFGNSDSPAVISAASNCATATVFRTDVTPSVMEPGRKQFFFYGEQSDPETGRGDVSATPNGASFRDVNFLSSLMALKRNCELIIMEKEIKQREKMEKERIERERYQQAVDQQFEESLVSYYNATGTGSCGVSSAPSNPSTTPVKVLGTEQTQPHLGALTTSGGGNSLEREKDKDSQDRFLAAYILAKDRDREMRQQRISRSSGQDESSISNNQTYTYAALPTVDSRLSVLEECQTTAMSLSSNSQLHQQQQKGQDPLIADYSKTEVSRIIAGPGERIGSCCMAPPPHLETLIEDFRDVNLCTDLLAYSPSTTKPLLPLCRKVDLNPHITVGAIPPIPQDKERVNEKGGTARKSTSKIPSSSSTTAFSRMNDSDRNIEGKSRLELQPETTHPIVDLKPHQCGQKCVADFPYRTGDSKNKNLMAIPMLRGFDRELIKKGNVQRKTVVYRAPCRRRLRNIDEVHRYLRLTESQLGVDLFCFDIQVDCFTEFKPVRVLTFIKDISKGKENIRLSSVSSVDHSYPLSVDYCTERIPRPGVDLNLDPDFLICCDCTDDCRDKEKCQCWQLTIQATAAGPGGKINRDVGYEYRRLSKNVMTGIYECNKRCKCRNTCLNRVAQWPLQMRLQLFKTQKRGWGVRCLDDIPQGQFICVYVGELLTGQQANEEFGDEYMANIDFIEGVEEAKEGFEESVVIDDPDSSFIEDEENSFRYSKSTTCFRKAEESNSAKMSLFPSAIKNTNGEKILSTRVLNGPDEDGFVMDTKNIGNIGRYFNHSCEPNVFTQNVFVDTHDLRFPWIAFFALKFIKAGSELTWDYRYEVDSVPGKKLFCHCGAKTCRGRLL